MAFERHSTIAGDIFLQKDATHLSEEVIDNEPSSAQTGVDHLAVIFKASKPATTTEYLHSDGNLLVDKTVATSSSVFRKGEKDQFILDLVAPCEGPARVLVADDNLLVRVCLMNLLEQWGMNYRICANGTEAWKALQEETFDLLLIDLQMPGMDGHEVVEQLRAKNSCSNARVPIVALAGTDSLAAKTRMFDAGTNEFLTKPFCPEELNRTLVKYLKILPYQRTQLYSDIIDQHQLFHLYEDDYEHMYNMFSLFLKNTPVALNRMEKAMQLDDIEGLEREVHKVKPTFAMVGLQRIGQLAEHLEVQIQQVGQLSTTIKSDIRHFRKSVKEGLEVVLKEQQSITNYLK